MTNIEVGSMFQCSLRPKDLRGCVAPVLASPHSARYVQLTQAGQDSCVWGGGGGGGSKGEGSAGRPWPALTHDGHNTATQHTLSHTTSSYILPLPYKCLIINYHLYQFWITSTLLWWQATWSFLPGVSFKMKIIQVVILWWRVRYCQDCAEVDNTVP